MSTSLTFSYAGVCAGGNHLRLGVSVQGGAVRPFEMEIGAAAEPLTVDDLNAIKEILVRAHVRGLTLAQKRAEIQAGFTVVI